MRRHSNLHAVSVLGKSSAIFFQLRDHDVVELNSGFRRYGT